MFMYSITGLSMKDRMFILLLLLLLLLLLFLLLLLNGQSFDKNAFDDWRQTEN